MSTHIPKHTFDATLGFPGEGPSPQTIFDCVTANITSWNSGRKAIDAGELGFFDILAIQEHKLVSNQDTDEADRQVRKKGYISFLANANSTTKGGKSAGVGFIWPKHTCTRNPGTLYNDGRKLSIAVRIKGIGFVTVVSFYGTEGVPQDNLCEIDAMIRDLDKGDLPFMMVGDFNVKLEEAKEHRRGKMPCVCFRDGGPSCTTKSQESGEATSSTIDFAILSHALARISGGAVFIKCALATHRPIKCSFNICSKHANEIVYAIDRFPIPALILRMGPTGTTKTPGTSGGHSSRPSKTNSGWTPRTGGSPSSSRMSASLPPATPYGKTGEYLRKKRSDPILGLTPKVPLG